MKTVSKIIIYPIKSLNGVSLPFAEVTSTGFKNDRKFMLMSYVDKKMITLREFPSLYNIKVNMINEDLIQLENIATYQIPLSVYLNPPFQDSPIYKVNVWDDVIDVQSVNKLVDDWFSEALGIRCMLVRMIPEFFRQVDLKYANKGQGVLFADGFPYLICTESNLASLNRHLDKKVSMLHFRPNIVIENSELNEEKNWKSIEINNHIFDSFKPCARCQVISIEPETMTVNEQILPFMAKNYIENKKIIFGLNACLKIKSGKNRIKVGDEVTSITRTNPK
ncbi:MAG: MOSC domain-containing protein [Bacteroidota bacterium]